MLLSDYLTHGKAIDGSFYASLIEQLRVAILKKRHYMLLLHENAPVHKSYVVQTAMYRAGFIELNHPACSPDITPTQIVLTRSEPAGFRVFRHVPCNRIPAGFSTDEFRSVPVHSSRFRLESRRNLSGENPAGIRLQGT